MKSSEIRLALKKLISGEVLWDEEILKFYSVDASLYQVIPKVIVIPKTEKDVISIVKFAHKNKIAVTARGSGTGLVGSALNDGIVMDMKRFDAIRIQKNHVKIGVGVTKGSLDKSLKNKQKFFPPNPSIGPYCSLGGIIGNNSSGSRTLKYGSTIDNIKEITFVDGHGRKITLPKDQKIGEKIISLTKQINLDRFPKVSKNSCGYRLDCIKSLKDTHKILAGSEGTLGIVLSANLTLKDIPPKRILFVVEYTSAKKAADNCQVIKDSGPSALEFVDKSTLENFNIKFTKNTKCLLFVEYDSNLKDNGKKFERFVTGKILKKIENEKAIERWWKYRDLALSYSLKSIKKEDQNPHIIEDAAVPLKNLGKLFSIIDKINNEFHTKTIMYGHAGDGNIHVRIISSRQNSKILDEISKKYFDQVIKLGGTITGEHGDGIARSEFVKMQYGCKNYQIFKELKMIFDPKNILNPGKITSHKRRFKRLEYF
ncbi:MAG: FAD-binding oxidoreductase [Nitrosopumilus sp.]|nr:FAD-binding oxidoreductase [Nitrosopumilus sp.]MDH3824431.1 FAD-binding oxidoreductase [Nitrosopumilus sp.]